MSGNALADGWADRHASDQEEEIFERVDDHHNADDNIRRRQDDREEEVFHGGNDGNVDADPEGQPNDVVTNNVDQRMQLMEHERNLAINIKQAIASAPEVDSVSDFMCAQLALIEGDNIEGAIERVLNLQSFREEYGIYDTAEDGMRCFMDYVALFPELHLCFTYDPEGGNYVMMYDNQKFSCSELCSHERLRTFLGGSYYTCAAFCPDFEAIRSGCVVVAECDGYDWKRDFDFHSLKKAWTEVGTQFPVWFQKIKYFNANNTMTIVANMMKPFLPKHLRNKLEFGCQYEQRLDAIFMQPSVEVANLRLLTRLEETLKRRYDNERTFRLST